MDKNWLIRTTSKQILGPISKQKILELIEKGSISGDDEICSGNGYWFKIREEELVKLYVFGNKKQPFNPISEAESLFYKQSQIKIEQLAPIEKINPNIPIAPKENFELDLEFDSQINISLEEIQQDADTHQNTSVQHHIEDDSAHDITVVGTNLLRNDEQVPPIDKKSAHPETTKESDVVLPNDDDLDFPDINQQIDDQLNLSAFAPPPKTPTLDLSDEEIQSNEEVLVEYPKHEIFQNLDEEVVVESDEKEAKVGEETIDGYKLPASEDLEYPDMGEVPIRGKASVFDSEFEIEQIEDREGLSLDNNQLRSQETDIEEEQDDSRKSRNYEPTSISELITDNKKKKIEVLEDTDDFENTKKMDKKLILIILGTFIFGIICALIAFKFLLTQESSNIFQIIPSAYAQDASENFVKKKVYMKKSLII